MTHIILTRTARFYKSFSATKGLEDVKEPKSASSMAEVTEPVKSEVNSTASSMADVTTEPKTEVNSGSPSPSASEVTDPKSKVNSTVGTSEFVTKPTVDFYRIYGGVNFYSTVGTLRQK